MSSPSSARDGAPSAVRSSPRAAARPRRGEWRALVVAAALLYPVSLVAVAAALRLVGERWWVTGVALYLPAAGFGAPLPVLAALLVAAGRARLLWTQAVAALALVLGPMGFVAPWPVPGAGGGPVVRVMSYNVNSLRAGAAAVAGEVERQAPDIVAMQEIGDGSEIRRLLAPRYPHVLVSGQFLLASRYPVVASRAPDRLSYFGHERSPRFQRYLVDTPFGRIAFYDVHPISPREGLHAIRGKEGLRREVLSGRVLSPPGAVAFQRNSGLRALQVRTFAEEAGRETLPVVIAGDTNLPASSNVLSRYLSRFQDGFREAGWGFGYTFPSHRYSWMRIDRILANDRLRFVRFAVGDAGASDHASDHMCVVADLTARRP